MHKKILLLLLISGCHVPDVDALQAHMRDECRVMPVGPGCAASNDDASTFVFSRFAARSVTSADTERCILDVDCSEERMEADPNGATDELVACLHNDGFEPWVDRPADFDCSIECELALSDCGEATDCGIDVVSACFGEYDACRRRCAL